MTKITYTSKFKKVLAKFEANRKNLQQNRGGYAEVKKNVTGRKSSELFKRNSKEKLN